MYTHIHLYTCTHTYRYIDTYIHTHIHLHAHIHIHTLFTDIYNKTNINGNKDGENISMSPHERNRVKTTVRELSYCCCCLSTPMTLATWGVRSSRL